VAFDAIFGQVKKIAQVMSEIAESSQRQHAGVARVTGSADTIRDGAQAGAATAEETAAAATELAAQAASMREMTATFSLGNDTPSPRNAQPARRSANGNGHANGNSRANGNGRPHDYSLGRFS
jgi:hypothetical protein